MASVAKVHLDKARALKSTLPEGGHIPLLSSVCQDVHFDFF